MKPIMLLRQFAAESGVNRSMNQVVNISGISIRPNRSVFITMALLPFQDYFLH